MPPVRISFIVPFSHRNWCPDDNRLITLLATLQDVEAAETILHLAGDLPSTITNALTRFPNLIQINAPKPKIYSAGQARNHAVSHARGDYLFFVDADLLLHPALIQALPYRTATLETQGIQAFDMYPCIYLGEQVDWMQATADQAFSQALQGFMQGHYHIAQGIALASSCLLINRQWFTALGGFDAAFVGHGGEDLELIHRLCLHYSAGALPKDYINNHKTTMVADYQGFRRYFACYAMAHLFSNRFLVHRWHPRPLTKGYHRARKVNDNLLITKLANQVTSLPILRASVSRPECWAQDYCDWLTATQQAASWPVTEYPGLFRLAEHEKVPRPLKNKLRKLLLNPCLFFKDALQKFK